MKTEEFRRIVRDFVRELQRMKPDDRPVAVDAFRNRWRQELTQLDRDLAEELAQLDKQVKEEVDPELAQLQKELDEQAPKLGKLERELEEARQRLEAEVARGEPRKN
jgi:predicted  nucleic acid-binding Zn-ribbon protein